MAPTTVDSTKGEGWGLITLSSAGGLNKLGTDTLLPLMEEIRSNLSGGCRCLGIAGQGGSFAVGADLKEIARLTTETARSFSDLGNAIFRLLENSGVIVVAGINGFCLGGGLDLALAADWRLATERSVFGHPGADLGLITGFGGTQRLPRLIGGRRAARWLFTADRIGAGDAYEAGFVQEICRNEEFDGKMMERIRMFADLETSRVVNIKGRLRGYCDGWRGERGTGAAV